MSGHLLHLDLVLAEHALQALPSIEQHAPLLVKEEHEGGAVVLHVCGKHLRATGMQAPQAAQQPGMRAGCRECGTADRELRQAR